MFRFLSCTRGEKEDAGPTRLKMVVVGDGECGKTCLLYRFTNNDFCPLYRPTVFETQAMTVDYKDQQVHLLMFDTAGQNSYDRLRPLSYSDTDVMVICYAVDSSDSLENVHINWLPEVRYFCGNIPILLVGNKTDLRTPESREAAELAEMKKKRPFTKIVEYEEGLAAATKTDAAGFFECSSKTGEGTDAIFKAVIRAGMESKLKKPMKRLFGRSTKS